MMEYFTDTIANYCSKVAQYESETAKSKARSIIPLSILRSKAKERLENEEIVLGIEDSILIELLHWFKFEFFSWVDSPQCSKCSGKTKYEFKGTPSDGELEFGASSVECYRCLQCSSIERFPRYNDPLKLLETRQGRCGEWANCFTLCCRAVGYDARLVLDWGDHVWTEVYSLHFNRWLHADPCENILDKPLLYEKGWGKQLTYVIAFSKDEVQDVTWRYVSSFSKTLEMRKSIDEDVLIQIILKRISQMQINMPENHRQFLLKRRVLELVEFFTPNTDKGGLSGRTSGSLEWRLSRNETKECTITPEDDEINKKRIKVTYSCKEDQYFRGLKKIKGWNNLLFNFKSIFRKEEPDWKMCYLARCENSDQGSLVWKIDLKGYPVRISTVVISSNVATYNSGCISWKINSSKKMIELAGACNLNTNDFKGEEYLVIEATLSGGSGGIAWQQSQLFRESLNDNTKESLLIDITLEQII